MLQSLRTVVFADLTGSTGLFESVGNVMATRLITRAIQCVGSHLAQAGGRVVKYLGDGVMVMFDDVEEAVKVCAGLPDVLHELAASGSLPVPLAVKVGIDYGSIVEHGGDCYGDAVNVASRLSDLARANEILLSGAVHQCLRNEQRADYHSLDRVSIKGRSEAIKVWRADWGRTAETTLVFPIRLDDADDGGGAAPCGQCRLELTWRAERRVLGADEEPLVIGRGEEAGFVIDDPRVSRRHARIECSDGQYVLTDFSSNGTWVRPAGSVQALSLRREGIILHGEGQIAIGVPPDNFIAPTLDFRIVG